MEEAQSELFVTTVILNWELALKRISAVFDRHSDEDLLKSVAPGKNRVIYLLGHLISIHDNMLPLLGIGERRHLELDALFLTSPDNADAVYPPVQQLRSEWTSINRFITERLREWKPEEWLQRHTAVSPEDFAKEPHRNRLNLVLSRTGHVSFHAGQLALLKL
jgi:hypothetical protein